MRPLALILLCLAVSTSALGDAVAGRTHVLLEGRQPYWVPFGGGRAIPLATSWGLPVSAAYDGENFVADGIGTVTPLRETLPPPRQRSVRR